MNAQVKPNLILQTIAAEHVAKCRAIFAGDEMTGEQIALSQWWQGLKQIQKRALFLLAGINHGASGKDWMQLPEKQRAALVLTANSWAENMQTITTTLKGVRQQALEKMKAEARRVNAMPSQVAA